MKKHLMKKTLLIASCVMALLAPSLAAAQDDGIRSGAGQGAGAGSGAGSGATGRGDQSASQTTSTSKDGKTTTTTTTVKTDDQRFIRSLQNVQVEFTLTDQQGTQTPEKKTVSMIVSSSNWGKIRSAATVMNPGESPMNVELNVDARPFVSTDGLIQLEMTLVYAPSKTADPTGGPRQRPTGINQSQTVVLQSGKPLIISQAADPVVDRKVVVEVKATLLK